MYTHTKASNNFVSVLFTSSHYFWTILCQYTYCIYPICVEDTTRPISCARIVRRVYLFWVACLCQGYIHSYSRQCVQETYSVLPVCVGLYLYAATYSETWPPFFTLPQFGPIYKRRPLFRSWKECKHLLLQNVSALQQAGLEFLPLGNCAM